MFVSLNNRCNRGRKWVVFWAEVSADRLGGILNSVVQRADSAGGVQEVAMHSGEMLLIHSRIVQAWVPGGFPQIRDTEWNYLHNTYTQKLQS